MLQQRFVHAKAWCLIGPGAVLIKPDFAALRIGAFGTPGHSPHQLGLAQTRQIHLKIEIEPKHVGHPTKQVFVIGVVCCVAHCHPPNPYNIKETPGFLDSDQYRPSGLLSAVSPTGYNRRMFTIEHEFDSTVITLVDDEGPHLREDVVINAFDDGVTLEQYEPVTDRVMRVSLSMSQLRDIAAALDLPEGAYRRIRDQGAG